MSKFIVLEGWGTAAEQVRQQVAANLSACAAGKGSKARRRARVIENRIVAAVGSSGFTTHQWRVILFANGCAR